MAIAIRFANRGDIPELEGLIRESVRALGVGYYTPRQIESALVHVFGVDSQLIADRTYYVAETHGRIVGCGGWSKRKVLFGGDQAKAGGEEEDVLLDPRNDPARIRAFFVHPNWTRRGIGSRIIKACEEAALRADFARIELAATLSGEPLYAALDYEAIERFAIPFPDGESLPLVRMAKVIREP